MQPTDPMSQTLWQCFLGSIGVIPAEQNIEACAGDPVIAARFEAFASSQQGIFRFVEGLPDDRPLTRAQRTAFTAWMHTRFTAPEQP